MGNGSGFSQLLEGGAQILNQGVQVQLKATMAGKSVPSVLFCVMLLTLALAQGSQQPSSQALSLNYNYNFDLQSDTPASWVVTLPGNIDNTKDLFITVQSPTNRPLQEPSLSIKTLEGAIQTCDAASNQFAGICRIDRSKLASNMALFVTAKCMVSCHLAVVVTLEKRLQISLEKPLTVKSPLQSVGEYEFELEVPLEQEFSELAIYAQINQFSETEGGLELFGNIGDENTPIPSKAKHDLKGKSIFWGGSGLFFSKHNFSSGKNIIKIYMSLSADMEVKLYSQLTKGNGFTVKLEQTYFEFVAANQPKNYYLDLADSAQKLKADKKTVALEFVTYAGSPDIRVAFDKAFTTELSGKTGFGSITFLITQALRKNSDFKTGIYIEVSSKGNADFYFHTALHEQNYLSVSSDVAYYNELARGEVFNYFLQDIIYLDRGDRRAETKRSYTIKIDSQQGEGEFGVRRCKEAEKGASLSACVVDSASALAGVESDIKLTRKSNGQFYQILFEYDLKQCEEIKTGSEEKIIYYCSFHAFGASKGQERLEYTWMMSKRYFSSLMKEGQLHRDTIFKGQELYHRFGLTSLDDVERVAFFITILEGDVTLLASTSNPYPDLDSAGLLKSDIYNRIVFGDSELSNSFFLTVKAAEFSEYTIGVEVSRRNKPSSSGSLTSALPLQASNSIKKTNIKLQIGLSLEYILKPDDSDAYFSVTSHENTTIKIDIVELIGNVEMKVVTQKGVEVKCKKQSVSTTSVDCTLDMQAGQTVDLVVSGSKGLQQQFVVSYYKPDNCVPYNFNLPLYKQLPKGAKGCVTYSITKQADLVMTTSVSVVHLIQGHLQLQLCIHGKCLERTVSHHEIVQKEMLSVLCQFHYENKQSCPITLTFSNTSPSPLEFSVILEERDMDTVLFDGIIEKITSTDLSTTNGKKFYYEVGSTNTIIIFFKSLTSDQFTIVGHFVSRAEFLTDSASTYVKYQARQQTKMRSGPNYFEFSKKGTGTNVFAISFETVDNYCNDCVLTLSVYSDNDKRLRTFSAFEMEVSQHETTIKLGESKIGYLELDDIYRFELEQPTSGDSIVSVRDLNKESATQKTCFQMSLGDVQSFGNEEVIVVNKFATNLNLFVTAVNPVCAFQVSYTHLDYPITNAIQNHPYSFEVQEASIAYFVYTHSEEESFEVYPLLNSGQARIGIIALDSARTLESILSASPDSFSYTNDQSKSGLLVTTNSEHFCSDCSYLIAVSTKFGAKGELFISALSNPVPLSRNSLLRERISVEEEKYRTYSFNSAGNFNLTFNIIYGRVKVTVLDSQGQIRKQRTIYGTTTVEIEHDALNTKHTYEYQAAGNDFVINVDAEIDSSYTIKPSKVDATQRLFEGVTSYLSLVKLQPVVFEFFNMHDRTQNTHNTRATLNLVVEVIKKFVETLNLADIKITAALATKDGASTPITIISRANSDFSINVELPLLKGDYYITMESSEEVHTTLLLVKQSLIRLKPEETLLMTKPGTVQLYSPNKPVMMEIFTCSGEIQMQASDVYGDFTAIGKKSSNQVALKHTNYGGHYVVSTQAVKGDYFVKINSKGAQTEEPSYLLNYYYFDSEEVLPYELIKLQSEDISYSLGASSITFALKPIFVKDITNSPIRDYEVQYRFYFANSKNSITKYSNCRLDTVITKIPTSSTSEAIQFILEIDDMESLSDVYFTGAEAVVKLALDADRTRHYPRELSLIYDTVQMSNPHSPVSNQSTNYSVKQVLLMMLLPFALAGVTVYFFIRFCIQKFKSMVPDSLNEDDQPQIDSEEVINSAAVTASTIKDSAGPLRDGADM